jgi:hypothetical protein
MNARLTVIALTGGQSNLRFFTRGPFIGGESISLRASAVVDQTAGFFSNQCKLIWLGRTASFW